MSDKITQWSKHVRNNILTGLIVIIPIGVSVWLCLFVYELLTTWSVDLLQNIGISIENEFLKTQTIRICSLILAIVILFIIGQLIKYTLGKKLLTYTEHIILKIPGLNIVYSTIRQIIDAIKSSKSVMFRKVVLFEYPRKELYVIGFLTNENSEESELTTKTGKELFSVFLPTTPNPTSGFMLLIPKEDCIILNMEVSDAMRLIISGGAIGPRSIEKLGNTSKIAQEQLEPQSRK